MDRIIPSKPDYWHGTAGDGRFTREQDRAVRDGRPWNGSTYTVKLKLERPTLDHRDTIEIECPLLAVTKTGRLVICPNGMTQWLNREGLNK